MNRELVTIDLTDLEAEYFLRHQYRQGEVDALRDVACMLNLYNAGKLPFAMMQMRLASRYAMAQAQRDNPQMAGAREVYSSFLHQLDEKG